MSEPILVLEYGKHRVHVLETPRMERAVMKCRISLPNDLHQIHMMSTNRMAGLEQWGYEACVLCFVIAAETHMSEGPDR